MARRALSTASIGWSSSITFATLGTAVTTLVLVPGLNVLFTVLLGADLAANDTVRIGCATALIATLSSVAAGIVARVATDRWIGVFEYVCTARPVDAGYWLGAAAVPALLASVTGLSNVGIVWLLSLAAPSTGEASGLLLGAIALMPVAVLGGVCLGIFAAGLGLLASVTGLSNVGIVWLLSLTAPSTGAVSGLLLGALELMPVAVLGGVCLGIFAAGLGLYLSDPYTGSNFLAIILPVSAGVIVPVSTYPAWLAWLCSWVPGSRLVQALDASGGIASSTTPDIFLLLAADTALGMLYAAIGLGLTYLAARRIRAGARASLL